jgi:hypothetical protein
LDSVQLPADQWDALRPVLDEAGENLYAKALLSLPKPLSVALMPQPLVETPALAAPAQAS